MASYTSRQTSRDLGGKYTQVFVQSFADRVIVLITQMGKVGNLIQATLPATASLLPPPSEISHSNKVVLPEASPAVELTPLLGSAPSAHLHTLHSLYASQIATIIWTEDEKHGLENMRKSVVVGLALAKSDGQGENEMGQRERDIFEDIMVMLYNLLRAG